MGGMQRTVGKTGAFWAKQGDSMQFGSLCKETGESMQPGWRNREQGGANC